MNIHERSKLAYDDNNKRLDSLDLIKIGFCLYCCKETSKKDLELMGFEGVCVNCDNAHFENSYNGSDEL